MRRFGFKGFSLIEVMVSLGILGAASLGVMKLTSQSTKTQKRLELNQNALDLMNRINLLMLDSRSCAATLAGSITDEIDLTAIRGQYSAAAPITDVFIDGLSYFNNSIAISDIKIDLKNDAGVLVPLAGDPTPSVDRKYGQMRLRIQFRKTSATNSESNNVNYIKYSPWVSVVTNRADVFQSCHSSEFSAIQTARQRVCNDLRGTINAASGRCELRPFANRGDNNFGGNPDNDGLETMQAVSSDFGNQAFLNNDRDETLNGDLIIDGGTTLNPDPNPLKTQNYALRLDNGDLLIADEANGMICIGGKCRDFDQISCPSTLNPAVADRSRVITGIDRNGVPICTEQARCDNSNQYFDGFNADGTRRCPIIPNANCGANSYVTSIDADGSVNCGQLPSQVQGVCGYRRLLAGYNAVTNTKVCKRLFQDVPLNRRRCTGSDNFISRINEDGTVRCSNITGGTLGVYRRTDFHGTGVTLLSTSRPRWTARCSRCGGRCTPSCGANGRAVTGRRCSRDGNCGWSRWRNCSLTCESTSPPTYRLRTR